MSPDDGTHTIFDEAQTQAANFVMAVAFAGRMVRRALPKINPQFMGCAVPVANVTTRALKARAGALTGSARGRPS